METLKIKIYMFVLRHDIIFRVLFLIFLLILAYIIFKDSDYNCNLKTLLNK